MAKCDVGPYRTVLGPYLSQDAPTRLSVGSIGTSQAAFRPTGQLDFKFTADGKTRSINGGDIHDR